MGSLVNSSIASCRSDPGRTVSLSYSWDFLFFVTALLLYILATLFLPSSVSLSHFILAVPKRGLFGKESRISSTFLIAILYGTHFFYVAK